MSGSVEDGQDDQQDVISETEWDYFRIYKGGRTWRKKAVIVENRSTQV